MGGRGRVLAVIAALVMAGCGGDGKPSAVESGDDRLPRASTTAFSDLPPETTEAPTTTTTTTTSPPPTAPPATRPPATAAPARNCDPSYPGVCIPPPPPDLDCGDIPFRRFQVVAPDPHGFDRDADGVGCESG